MEAKPDTFMYHQEHGAEIFTAEQAKEAAKHGWVTTPALLNGCDPYDRKDSFKSRFTSKHGMVFETKYFKEIPISPADKALMQRLLEDKGASLSSFVTGRGGKVSVDADRNPAKPIFDAIIRELGDKVEKGKNNTWVLAKEE
jgi:hypothetical protein